MTKTQAPLSPKRIDLNLLRVFDAVFEDRNLLRAGKRLHLSQSAISHALSRLREALQDELFVRRRRHGAHGACLAMAMPLREAMRAIHDTLGVRPFDPATTTRKFVVAANDYVTSVLLTKLARRMGDAAPSSDLVVRPSTRLDLASRSTSDASTSRWESSPTFRAGSRARACGRRRTCSSFAGAIRSRAESRGSTTWRNSRC